ncbi:heme peroxidase [Marasmius fiardii PR-910]|nr:heme peroxidase [Marasmius fiardii PR-910]
MVNRVHIILSSFCVTTGAIQRANAALTKRVACPDGVHTTSNAACCALFPLVKLINKDLFDGGECGEEVHESLRLVFHDAIGIPPPKGLILLHPPRTLLFLTCFHSGGADDSIMIFSDIKFAFHANNTVSSILERFEEVSFSPNEVVALIASNSIAAADHVDEATTRRPFDSTPGVFDAQFFVELQLCGTSFPGTGGNAGEAESPIKGEIRLQSDQAVLDLALDSRSACHWQSFVGNQAKVQREFQAAMIKLSTLGHNRDQLIDCLDVIPVSAPLAGSPHLPAGLSMNNIEQTVSLLPPSNTSNSFHPSFSVPPVRSRL